MRAFEIMHEKGHEQIVFCRNEAIGLKSIIAIHDTTLGPALGGCRMWPYKTEEEALEDVCRLSRGMTYKAAAAGLNLGGGKAVIIGDPKTQKSEALFRAFGRFVDSLGGRYITAEDVGTSVEDMEWVRMETRFVTGLSRALGGSGDPSTFTALGVYSGMQACVKEVFGREDLKGLKVLVQGLGHVGYHLCKHLHREEAKLFVTDIDADRVKKAVQDFGAEALQPEKIFDLEVDVFAPCALGNVLNDETIPKLKARIVAGAANNQLGDGEKHGKMLFDKGILYTPDYVLNAGGLINVANELRGQYNMKKSLSEVKAIKNIVARILEVSRTEKIPTNIASNRLAERRLTEIRRIKGTYISSF